MVNTKITYKNVNYSINGLFDTDHIFKHLKYTNSFYELKLLEKIKSLNIGGTYVDVGANIGNHTLFFSENCNSKKVVSIELDKNIFECLSKNVKENSLSKEVLLINSGVGEKIKNVTTSNIDKQNVGMTKILNDGGETQISTLDNLLSDIHEINLIKLDVEGYELNAIKGATEILEKHSPILVTELTDTNQFIEFEKYISKFGYKTDKVSYATTPTYFWYKEYFDFIYIIPTFERYEKIKKLIDSIINLGQNCKIIIVNDGSKDDRYESFKNYSDKLIYLKNETNNGIKGYWKTVNLLLDELSKHKFKYGIMMADDLVLSVNFSKNLNSIISPDYITRIFTQKGIVTNWGTKDWIDGAFCAPYSFFKKINFELFPVIGNETSNSSGVGNQMTSRLNKLKFKVMDYGSLVYHDGNNDSVMHPNLRRNQPLTGTEFIGKQKNTNIFNESKKISIIIPTFDSISYLEECLNSTITSSYNLSDIEVLVGIDGCEKTLDYVKTTHFDSRIKFYYFEKNVGPYVIKNTLSTLSKSDKLFFFDSDDIMEENLLITLFDKLDQYDCIKPKYFNFKNTLTNKDHLIKNGSKHFGEGVFAIKKSIFLHYNGFEPWRCAADSDFMARLQLNRIKILQNHDSMFFRRMHSKSLTNNRETGWGSKKRDEYILLSKSKKSWGPLPKLTIEPCSVLLNRELISMELSSPNLYETIVDNQIEERKKIVLRTFEKIRKELTEEEKIEIINKRKELFLKINPPSQMVQKRIRGVKPNIGRPGIRGRNNFNP